MSRYPGAQAGHAACWRTHPPEVTSGVLMRLSFLTSVALAVDFLKQGQTHHLSPGAVLHDEATSHVADRLHMHLKGYAEGSDLRFGVAALLGLASSQSCVSTEFAIDQWLDQHVVIVAMPEAIIHADHPVSGAFHGLRDAWSHPPTMGQADGGGA